MASETLASNRLRIRRLRVDCLVPTDHPSPERVSRQVADVAERNLVPTLRAILERSFAESDPSLCFVKRLDLSIDVNVGWDAERLARHLAKSTIQHLYAEVGSAGNSSNVVRFRNPAEYLASFLRDLVQGQAWSKWYYEPFDGVRVLPLSAAVRTVLCNQADYALEALHRMDHHNLREALTSLTRSDCERVIESLAAEGSASDQDAAYEAVGATLRQLFYADVRRLTAESRALWLFVETTRRNATCADRSVGEAAYALCRCMHYVDAASIRDRERVMHLLNTGNLAGVDAQVFANAVDWLMPILSRPESWRRGFVDLLAQEGRFTVGQEGGQGEAREVTPFGGIFYLLPLFVEIPLEGYIEPDTRIDGVSLAAVLRLLILAKVYGCPDAAAVARDPLVQALCGIPPGVMSRSLLSECQRKLTVAGLERAAQQVVQHGVNIDEENKVIWVLTTTATQDGAVTLLLDAERVAWLWAIRAGPHNVDVIMRKVKQALDLWPSSVRAIGCDTSYYKNLQAMRLFDLVLDLSVAKHVKGREGKLLTIAVQRMDSLAEELTHLSLPAIFGLSQARDRALSVLTQAYLRRLASRLPGFAWSSGRFLAQNLFACQATLERESERHVVRLSRPPLSCLLNMTGLNRKQFALPWFDSRPFILFPEDL